MDLSIIIPAYNMQEYIAACLRSVISCPKDTIEMECIVVNDGSRDDTAAIVQRYRQRDNRIRLIDKENSGVSDSRNRGIEAANGRYIMFLDADDRLCGDVWELICPAISDAYADFVAFSYITLYENGKMHAQPLPLSDMVSTDMMLARKLMYADSVFNTCWGKLFRSDMIRDNEIQFRTDLPVGEDYVFVAQYFSLCESAYMTKNAILYYLQRSGSAMRSYTMEQRLGFTAILYDYNRKLVDNTSDQELKQSMNVYYLKVLTNLFLEYARIYKGEELADMYHKALENNIVVHILHSVDKQHIYSKLKQFEYGLLMKGNIKLLCSYFRLKAKI